MGLSLSGAVLDGLDRANVKNVRVIPDRAVTMCNVIDANFGDKEFRSAVRM